MEKLKDFWKNKTDEERRKIVVYSIFGVVAVLLFIGVYALNSGDDKQVVSEISNPDAKEAQKYNSRTEANQLGTKDSTSMNTAMDGIFGSSSSDEFEADTYSQPSYTEPTYTEPTYTPPNYNNNNNSGSSSSGSGGKKSSNYNSHSTYGDYSMWQAEEPKNNSIEYTELKNYPSPKKQQKSASQSSSANYEEVQTYTQPSYGVNEKKSIPAQGKKVRAKLVSKGYATSGRSLSFVLLEEVAIGGEQAKKGQVITGNAVADGERLLVKFGTAKVNGKTVNANAFLIGYDGQEGLPVRGSSNNNGNGAGEFARNEAQGAVSSIPVVGGILSRATSNSSSRNNNESKIQLPNNVECTIMFN